MTTADKGGRGISRLTAAIASGVVLVGVAGLAAWASEQRAGAPAAASAQAVPGDEVRAPGSYAFGYSLGAQIGENIRQQNVDVDFDKFMEGFRVALTGGQSSMSDEAMQQAFEGLQRRQEALAAAAASKRLQDNQTFLANNGKQSGVETTSSGLQYQVLKEGSGKKPGAESLVVTHYEGKLLDGTVFDSSVARGTPAEFRVDGVIRGWQEALQAMREGDKWRVWVPSELGYGPAGAGRMIPPNSVLVFEVELIDVKDDNDRPNPARSIDPQQPLQ